jgi:hypothetical protein
MAQQKAKIYSDFYKGHSKSKYHQDGFDEIVGCEIHEELGVIRSSLAMEKESGNDVSDLVLAFAVVPDGTVYAFGDTGRIYRRPLGGGWAYMRTNANGKTVAARYKDGYVYYASRTKLGRMLLASEEFSDSWATFSVGAEGGQHPMAIVNDQLLIGDGHFIALVDEGETFVPGALDLPTHHAITAIEEMSDAVVFGTKAGYAHSALIGRWDTVSDSWNLSDPLPETAVASFLKLDNEMYAVAVSGNIYAYNGSQAIKYSKVRGEAPDTNPNVSAMKDGLVMFGGKKGVWAFGSADYSMPKALHIQHIPSQGQGLDSVGALIAVGQQLLLSWRKGSSYGIDKLSAVRGNGWFITPVLFGSAKAVRVKYADLPDGASIGMSTKENHGSFGLKTVVPHARQRFVQYESGFRDLVTLQVKVSLDSSENGSPSVEYVEIS